MNRLKAAAAAICLPLCLQACATDRTYGTSSDVTVTDLTTLPVPLAAGRLTLNPLDSVEIKVLQDPDLSGTYTVNADGRLDFPYLGQVQASGLSPNQLAEALTRQLAGKYVVSPQVSVRALDVTPPTVSVGGQVAKPGPYPAAQATTLLRAVNQAGGGTEYAKKDDVLIIREVSGQRYIGLYNLGAIERGNYPDPALIPNDIVMVGDSPARRRLDTILQIAPLLTSSLIVVDNLRRKN